MTKIPFIKPALTIDEQIQLLERKGLVIDDKDEAKHSLKHLNYYRLSAYWLPYQQSRQNSQFVAGTKFSTIIDAYIFDRELRLLIMDAIERIEVSIRTGLAYCLAHEYGTHPHLDINHFSDYKKHIKLIEKLVESTNQSREVYLKHFRDTYKEPLPPIWAMVEVFTFGQLSHFYEDFNKRKCKRKISDQFGLSPLELQSILHTLVTVRNQCAHHSRTWNKVFPIAFQKPNNPDIAKNLNTTSQKSMRQIYNSLVVLAHFMNTISPNHNWKTRLLDLMEKQDNQSAMGFPQGWQKMDLWK